MSLSPYLKPSVLNGGLFGATRGMEGMLTNTQDNPNDAFDKRKVGNKSYNTISQKISEAKTVSDMLTNALGSRSPYYKIGEIQSTALGQFASRYMQDTLGNVIRAITSVYDELSGQGQTGVVIDGFGTVSGDIDVDFTKNPIIFTAASVTDGRIRTPNKLTMTVYVSNLYNDDGLGAAVDYLTALDPTGIAGEAVNIIARNGNTRAQEALYNLRRLQETGRPFSVYTPHGVYENMSIKTLKPTTTAENVDMLECEIVFQELIMYEPYYESSNITYPIRTNIIDDTDSSTLTSLANAKSNTLKKLDTYYKAIKL